MRLRSQFATLDGSHPDPDPVPNTHIVSMDWSRIELDVMVPIGESSELEFQLPYDVKDIEAKYELPDGTEFDNPVGDLHHRTERLEGPADFKVYCNFTVGEWRLSGGLNLPVGETVENPYLLGDLGLNHQHVQFGTGTFDPLARLSRLVHVVEGVAANFSAGAQIPLMENRHGYQAPPVYDFAAGPRFALNGFLNASLSYSVLYQGRGYWDGDPDPNTGYVIQAIHLSLPIRIEPGIYLVPNVYRALHVKTRDEGDTFELEWIVGLSMEIPLGSGE